MPDRAVNDQSKNIEKSAVPDSKALSSAVNPPVGETPIYAAPPEAKPESRLLPNLEIVKPVELPKLSEEKAFRDAVKDLLKQAKEGKSVNFEIDTRVAMTGPDNKPVKGTQATILFDELKTAYPERAFMFTKPDFKPGDKGYTEVLAPKITTDGLQISSKENAITLAKEITLSDGTTVPAGSKFAVGTIYDGKQFRSADPESKVWVVNAEGQYVQVAEAGKGFAAAPDVISTEVGKRGQIADRHQSGIDPATGRLYENHLIVRTTGEKTPDGRPILDVYPSGGPGFEASYRPGQKDGYYTPKAKGAGHLLLPENVTVNAETKYGHSLAAGADQTYFMDNGFGDAKDATAKNYNGETDLRSAQEIMRIRGELGMTEVTQAEAGLAKSRVTNLSSDAAPTESGKAIEPGDLKAATKNSQEKIPEKLSEVTDLARKTNSLTTAEQCVDWLKKTQPDGFVDSLYELAKNDSRAAIPALQALVDRPETSSEARKLVAERWNSGEFLSMLKDNKVDLKGMQHLLVNEKIVTSDIWREAWIGTADSPEARARLAHEYLNSTEREGSHKWTVEIPNELRRLALDYVVENRLSGFDGTLAGAAKVRQPGVSELAAASVENNHEPAAIKTASDIRTGSQSTKIIDLHEQAARTQVADAASTLQSQQSEVVRNILKDAGIEETRLKELERRLTSTDDAERTSAVKEIDKHFQDKVASAKSASEAHTPAMEGKSIEEKLGKWTKWKSTVKENKGKLATAIVLAAPIVAGMMKQENSKESSQSSTFSK